MTDPTLLTDTPVAPADTALVRGACPHDCPDTCGTLVEVVDGRAVGFRGDPDHPITDGWLCGKVRPYLEHVYHPDRLTTPLRRVGPKGAGQFAPISWDEAIGEIGDRWRGIIAEHGAEAILPYSYSGTLGLVQMAVSNGRFWNRLGASQLERAICGDAAQYAVERTLGARWAVPYADTAHSQAIFIWGHNPASTAPHFMPYLKDAQRRGCVVVVIDPKRTRTARTADWHVAPGREPTARWLWAWPTSSLTKGCTTKPGWRPTPSAGRSCGRASPTFRRSAWPPSVACRSRTWCGWPGSTPPTRPA